MGNSQEITGKSCKTPQICIKCHETSEMVQKLQNRGKCHETGVQTGQNAMKQEYSAMQQGLGTGESWEMVLNRLRDSAKGCEMGQN